MSLYQFKVGDRVVIGKGSAKEGEYGILSYYKTDQSKLWVVLDNRDGHWHFDSNRDKLHPVSRSPLWEALS